jgi:uncharacterized RDD family membrane protein YckC
MPGSPYAGIVTRLAALGVDALLLTLAIPFVANGPPSLWASLAGSAPGWLKVISQTAAALLPFAYFTMCWWGGGRTVGGLLFGTVVRRHGGGPLGLGRSATRAVLGLLLPLIWLFGMVTILWDDRRRALHDRVFRTVVLRAARPSRAGLAGTEGDRMATNVPK